MKEKKKGLAIGTSDFKSLITGNGFYIDKTKFIEEILEDLSEVKLFTRPRRFGKTLNLSMLKYFFDIENSEENRKLFDNLYISQSEYMKYQGQYPVIFISMRNVEAENWEKSYFNTRNLVSSLYRSFKHIREKIDEFDIEDFMNIAMNKDHADWEGSLKKLSKYLYDYYGKKAIILIDEYDRPMTNAWSEGYYEKSRSFFKNFYANALKDNEYLKFAILMGIIKVPTSGILTGLNNIVDYNVLSNSYSNIFGFTESEVKQAIQYYEIESNIEEIKKWYNGYKFGDILIYNPWSILNYLEKENFSVYSISTFYSNLIYIAIKNSYNLLFGELKKIFSDSTTEQQINNLTYIDNLKNPQEVWQLMLFGGYLTVEREVEMNVYDLRLPNYEVRTFFKDMFIEKLGGLSCFKELMKAFRNLEMESFEELLNETFMVSMSYHDISKTEKPYHTLILGMMLYLDNEYTVLSNDEAGYGRSDLALEPLDKRNRGYIFEFKIAKDEEEMKEMAEQALAQIEEKKYPVMLKGRGVTEIVYIGMAFCGKNVKVKHKVIKK